MSRSSPPPPNDDAAAVAAAANANATTPGGTPIVVPPPPPPPLAATATNAIAPTPGGTPIGSAQASAPTPTVTFQSFGSNVMGSTLTPAPLGTSGTNSFVTFAPPNASGGQQSSGNASSLPSGVNLSGGTNQTSSTTNVSSLVGPGTTQLPIASAPRPPKSRPAFLCPPIPGALILLVPPV